MRYPDIEIILTDKYLNKIKSRNKQKISNISEKSFDYISEIKRKHKRLPKVSIIVTIKGFPHLLHSCLESIVNQTYPNTEIILIDAFSQRTSLAICNKFKKHYPNIKVYNSEFYLESDLKNLGIEKATGSYISFVNGSDFISLNYIEYLLYIISKSNSDIAICDFIKVSESDSAEKRFLPPKQNIETLCTLLPWEAIENLHSSSNNICIKSVVLWNKLFKKTLFTNLRFPKNKEFEDEFTSYKLFMNSQKIISSNQKLYAYVQIGNHIRENIYNEHRLDILDAYENHMKFFKEVHSPYMLEKAGKRYLRMLYIIRKEISPFDIILDNKKDIIDNIDRRFVSIYKYILMLKSKHPYLSINNNEYLNIYNEYKTYIKIINTFNSNNLKYKHNKRFMYMK